MKRPTPTPDNKQPETKFRAAMKQILAVPKEEILKREAAYREKRAMRKNQKRAA